MSVKLINLSDLFKRSQWENLYPNLSGDTNIYKDSPIQNHYLWQSLWHCRVHCSLQCFLRSIPNL